MTKFYSKNKNAKARSNAQSTYVGLSKMQYSQKQQAEDAQKTAREIALRELIQSAQIGVNSVGVNSKGASQKKPSDNSQKKPTNNSGRKKLTGRALEQQQAREKALSQEYKQRIEHLEEKVHPNLKEVLINIEVGNLVFLVGPAGSGKTTMAMQVAEILGHEFYFTGAVHQKHELLGFIDAGGEYKRTPFRDAFEHGGLFLFDEYDASSPNAITAFNAALSNGYCSFPDGVKKAHESFIAIAAGNTYGTGATRQYVGRFQQDAASLDRFVFIEIDYDLDLELELAQKFYKQFEGSNPEALDAFVSNVLAIRKAVKDLEIQHIVSPRATIMGSKLIAKGMPMKQVYEQTVYKGMSETVRKQVMSKVDER